MVYCIDENIDEPIMLINTHIGFDDNEGMGIDGALFQKELLYLDTLGKKKINIWINSVGGNVMDGYNIASAILKTKTPVDTHNVGISASISGVIFMCGRNRYMMDYSLLMMHSPNGGSDKKVLDTMQDSLSTLLSSKSNLQPETISELMTATTWFNAKECLEKGFCTEIEITKNNNKKRITATNYAEIYTQANKITNKLLLTKTKNQMLKVTNKLGLNDDATEDSILNAIKEIENKANSEKEALKKQIEDSENALKDLKEKYNAMEQEIEDKAECEKMEKARNMVTEFANIGRIKNEESVIEKWVNLAKTDFEGTKSMIEDLPLNVIANKIEIDEKVTEPTITNFMAEKMKEINNKNNK